MAKVFTTNEKIAEFGKEIIPYIDGMVKVLEKYGAEDIFHISANSDGYFTAGIYNEGFEISRSKKSSRVSFQKEYVISEGKEESA